jgi:hypothetical protein
MKQATPTSEKVGTSMKFPGWLGSSARAMRPESKLLTAKRDAQRGLDSGCLGYAAVIRGCQRAEVASGPSGYRLSGTRAAHEPASQRETLPTAAAGGVTRHPRMGAVQ